MSETQDPEDTPGSRLKPLKEGSRWERWYAYAYFTGLLLVLIGAFALAVQFGLIDLETTFIIEANLGWVVEYLAALLLIIFAVWTFIQFVRIAGIGFFRGLISTIARIADNYELPQEGSTEEDQES